MPGEEQDTHQVTRLLGEIAEGRTSAKDELVSAVYQQLRQIAQVRMNAERPNHTLQATELVHQVYLKLGNELNGKSLKNRYDFYGAAAEAMRRILTDHARRRGAKKRGGDFIRVPMANIMELANAEDSRAVLVVNEAFEELQAEHPDFADVVRLRFFAGLNIAETAAVLDISTPTVNRRWKLARAMLHEILERKGCAG